jgi:hypothetical protein
MDVRANSQKIPDRPIFMVVPGQKLITVKDGNQPVFRTGVCLIDSPVKSPELSQDSSLRPGVHLSSHQFIIDTTFECAAWRAPTVGWLSVVALDLSAWQVETIRCCAGLSPARFHILLPCRGGTHESPKVRFYTD